MRRAVVVGTSNVDEQLNYEQFAFVLLVQQVESSHFPWRD